MTFIRASATADSVSDPRSCWLRPATSNGGQITGGIGMTEELLHRAFDPFVQGPRTLDRCQGGLGIGLTLVACVVSRFRHQRTFGFAPYSCRSTARLQSLRLKERIRDVCEASLESNCHLFDIQCPSETLFGSKHVPLTSGPIDRFPTEPLKETAMSVELEIAYIGIDCTCPDAVARLDSPGEKIPQLWARSVDRSAPPSVTRRESTGSTSKGETLPPTR